LDTEKIKEYSPYAVYVFFVGILWFAIFRYVVNPKYFWIAMSATTAILIIVSFHYFPKQLLRETILAKNEIIIGIISAFVLYGIFFLGKYILASLNLIPNFRAHIEHIYNFQGTNNFFFPKWLITVLLIFPICFGEEIFWRGFLQRFLADKSGKFVSLLITTFFYMFIHICTMNPVLILTALVSGLFWGTLFLWRKENITAPLISHIIFTPLVYIFFPLL
jgi:uncharacterized protein